MKFRWKRRVVPCIKHRESKRAKYGYVQYKGYDCFRRFDFDDDCDNYFTLINYFDEIAYNKEIAIEYGTKLTKDDYPFTGGW